MRQAESFSAVISCRFAARDDDKVILRQERLFQKFHFRIFYGIRGSPGKV